MTRRTRITLVVAVIVAGFAVGGGATFFLSRIENPVVEPPVWDLSELKVPEKMQEFDTFQGTVALRNAGTSEIECRQILTRFGFTEVLAADGKGLSFPHKIDAGASRSYLIRVTPSEVFGGLHEQITAEVGMGAASASATFELSTSVLPAWRAIPSAVAIRKDQDGQAGEAVVDVYDAFPGEGIAVESITVSDERLVTAELERLPVPYYGDPAEKAANAEPTIIKIPPSIWKYRFSLRFRGAGPSSAGPRFGFARVTAGGESNVRPLMIRFAVE